MKITSIVKTLRFIMAYAVIITVVVEIVEFAIKKLEEVKLPEMEKKPAVIVETEKMEDQKNV